MNPRWNVSVQPDLQRGPQPAAAATPDRDEEAGTLERQMRPGFGASAARAEEHRRGEGGEPLATQRDERRVGEELDDEGTEPSHTTPSDEEAAIPNGPSADEDER
jgi:hypothetical protein